MGTRNRSLRGKSYADECTFREIRSKTRVLLGFDYSLCVECLTLFLVCNVGSPRHSQLWRSQESFIGAVALSMWVWLLRWVRAGACNVRVSSGLSICGARLVRWAMRHQPSVTEVWWAAGVVGVTQQSHDALLCATRWQGQASALVAGMLPSKGCA